MLLRGAPSHCDGHGRCGFLSPAFYHWFTPFITSPFCFFRQGLDRTPPEHSISVPRAWPCVIGRKESHRLVPRIGKERTRMRVMRASVVCHGWTGASWQGSSHWSPYCCFLF